jgi:hypothetical protein
LGRGSNALKHHVFFCRAANGALSGDDLVTLNSGMSPWHDFDSGNWRRRAQRGARDILFAVALTVTAVVLIGVAWLGNSHGRDAPLGPSAEIIHR